MQACLFLSEREEKTSMKQARDRINKNKQNSLVDQLPSSPPFFGPGLFFITTNWLTTFRSIYGRVPVVTGGQDSTPSEFAFLKIIFHCRGLRLVVLVTFFVFSETNLPKPSNLVGTKSRETMSSAGVGICRPPWPAAGTFNLNNVPWRHAATTIA
jgi:hypothetical protein